MKSREFLFKIYTDATNLFKHNLYDSYIAKTEMTLLDVYSL